MLGRRLADLLHSSQSDGRGLFNSVQHGSYRRLRLSLRPGHLSSRVAWLCGMAWRRPRVSNVRGWFKSCYLLTLGRWFGVRPAVRGLATSRPYKFVRHSMYLSYILADIDYNLKEWNLVTLLLVLVGWAAL